MTKKRDPRLDILDRAYYLQISVKVIGVGINTVAILNNDEDRDIFVNCIAKWGGYRLDRGGWCLLANSYWIETEDMI